MKAAKLSKETHGIHRIDFHFIENLSSQMMLMEKLSHKLFRTQTKAGRKSIGALLVSETN